MSKKINRVSDLKSILQKYTEEYNNLKSIYEKELNTMSRIYRTDTDYYKELQAKKNDEFTLEANKLKASYMKTTNSVLKEARKSVTDKICCNVTNEELNALTLLQQLDRVDERTLKAYAEKFQGNSLASQVLSKIAKQNNVKINVFDTELALEQLENLENRVDKFFDKYAGEYTSLESDMLLASNVFEDVEEMYLQRPYQEYLQEKLKEQDPIEQMKIRQKEFEATANRVKQLLDQVENPDDLQDIISSQEAD